jgi:ribitol-5-phosphate 2-dehydrogenase (NADP+)
VMALAGPAFAFRLTQPFSIEAVEREVEHDRPGDVVLRPRLTGVCGSDLKLYAGARNRQALERKLPLALLHEGIADVVANGHYGGELRPGTRVVVIPNVPCYLAHPDRHPSKAEGCVSCRPGGAGENYCLDNLYLSSNTDGLAQTYFRHPESLVIPVPSNVSERAAVLTEPIATIAAACLKAPIRRDARYLILGDGPLGQLVAIWLTAHYRVPRDSIFMSAHFREHAPGLARLVGTMLDATRPESFARLRDTIDVAFECVGGQANEETLAQAVECLRPGATAVLFGPSERLVPLDIREVIGKGLVLLGCNRSFLPHFRLAMTSLMDPEFQNLLETVLSRDEFQVSSADDLSDGFYHAWTKREASKTLLRWATPE